MAAALGHQPQAVGGLARGPALQQHQVGALGTVRRAALQLHARGWGSPGDALAARWRPTPSPTGTLQGDARTTAAPRTPPRNSPGKRAWSLMFPTGDFTHQPELLLGEADHVKASTHRGGPAAQPLPGPGLGVPDGQLPVALALGFSSR